MQCDFGRFMICWEIVLLTVIVLIQKMPRTCKGTRHFFA
ncbi:Uncharacterized protein ChrSV_3910 [Chromobacterium vaccinii]|nr:Uncharacterized protein ChrSW_3910 [Chromobacterium vaccinii]QND91367.1 Uncharacterized protein ChrSV_3910 [Chromobacterium vaccinii]